MARALVFSARKTMYGGKHITKGDTIFTLVIENAGGPGLVGSGDVTAAEAIVDAAQAAATPHRPAVRGAHR